MAVSIGRKLQAFRDLLYPRPRVRGDADRPDRGAGARARPAEHAAEGDRAARRRWREAHGGLEQTEIDALATLQPDVLRKIIRDAFDRYFDPTLDRRAATIRRGLARAEAQEALDERSIRSLIARCTPRPRPSSRRSGPRSSGSTSRLRASTERPRRRPAAADPEPARAEAFRRGRLASPHLDRLGLGRATPGADRSQAIRQRRANEPRGGMTAPAPDPARRGASLRVLDEEAPSGSRFRPRPTPSQSLCPITSPG